MFMLELVPEPVWKTSTGNSASWCAGGDLRGGRLRSRRPARRLMTPSSPLTRAAARLDQRQRVDEARLQRGAADREVLDRALGLRPPQGLPRHLDLAHAVVLGAELGLVGAAHAADGTRADVEPVLLVAVLQQHVVGPGLGGAEHLAQRVLELRCGVGRPDDQHPARAQGGAGGRAGTARGRARRWPRGRGSRGRCRRRAAPGRTTRAGPRRVRRRRRRPRPRPARRPAAPGRAGWCRHASSRRAPARSRRRPPSRRGSRPAPRASCSRARGRPPPRPAGPRRGSRAAVASARSVLVSRVSITKTPLARSSSEVAAASSRRSRSTSSPRSDSARAISTYSICLLLPRGRHTKWLLVRPNRMTSRGTSYGVAVPATSSHDVSPTDRRQPRPVVVHTWKLSGLVHTGGVRRVRQREERAGSSSCSHHPSALRGAESLVGARSRHVPQVRRTSSRDARSMHWA